MEIKSYLHEFGELTEFYTKLEEEFCSVNKINKSTKDAAKKAFEQFLEINPTLRSIQAVRHGFIAGYSARLKEEIERTTEK